MSKSIVFTSRLPVTSRSALEQLLFFNGCQDRVIDCIVDAVERFGSPEIVVEGDHLRVTLGGLPEVQTLYAIEADTGRPVGVAVYIRADLEHVTVLHIGVLSEFARGGARARDNLLLKLLNQLRRSSKRLKGVRRLNLPYGNRRRSARSRLSQV